MRRKALMYNPEEQEKIRISRVMIFNASPLGMELANSQRVTKRL